MQKYAVQKIFVDNLKNFVPKYEQSDENQGIKHNINMYTYTVKWRSLRKEKRISKKRKKVLDTEKVVWYYIKAVREAAVYLVN